MKGSCGPKWSLSFFFFLSFTHTFPFSFMQKTRTHTNRYLFSRLLPFLSNHFQHFFFAFYLTGSIPLPSSLSAGAEQTPRGSRVIRHVRRGCACAVRRARMCSRSCLMKAPAVFVPFTHPSDRWQAGSVSVVAVMESLLTQLTKPCTNLISWGPALY